MPLEFSNVAAQIEDMAAQAGLDGEERRGRLARALKIFTEADAGALSARVASCNTPWPVAGIARSFNQKYSPPSCPQEFSVLATDGSHIEVDRHSSLRCYLINIGSVALHYGENPDAHITSEARIYFGEDLTRTDPASGRVELIEGPLLGVKRAIAECAALADTVSKQVPDRVTLAMVDGSLVLWGLSPRDYEGFIRGELLDKGYLSAFDSMKKRSIDGPFALCACTSFPRNADLVNALRVYVCGCDPADCERCRADGRERECDELNGITDIAVFDAVLDTGQRSDVYLSGSKYVRQYYREHQIHFFYLKADEDILRVEVPQWVAGRDDLVGLTHALVLDQCRRGMGYPAALMEAHEKAVVTAADREAFRLLVERAMVDKGIDMQTSGKSRSKRTRWV
ncbi:MAG: DNA double-strand break repair nuclease NurA [Dehalococcoidia bacterium]|jgi:GNAT superfamily N-acetyltransferase